MIDLDATQTSQFFSTLYAADDIVEVRVIRSERNGQAPRSGWATAAEWAAGKSMEWLEQANESGWNIYAGVLPRKEHGATKNENTLPGAVLWADIDNVIPAEAGARLSASKLPHPTMIVNSGHGVQCYWKLSQKQPPEVLRPLVREIALHLRSDTAVQNEERVLRVPGFVNHKPPVVNAELLECHEDLIYDFDAIRGVVPEGASPITTVAPSLASLSSPLTTDDFTVERARRYLAMVPGSTPGGRTNTAFRVAATLLRDYALSESTAMEMLQRWDLASNSPPIQGDPQYRFDELSQILTNASKYGKHPVGALVQEPRIDDFDIDGFIEASTAPDDDEEEIDRSGEIPDHGPFPDHLLHVPGFLGDFATHITRSAIKPQPVLSLGAAIATLGVLTGQLVEGITGLRTNFYILGIAESGTGKDKPREMIQRFLFESGNDNLYCSDRLKSDAAIRTALKAQPCHLYLLDEIGEFLNSIKNAKHSPWLRNVMTELLTLYSSASSPMVKLGGLADATQAVEVSHPHVCLYGTSVPRSVFASMTQESITGGLLGRLLMFESATGNPEKQIPERCPIPESLIDVGRFWKSFEPDGNLTSRAGGTTSAPLIVEESSAATRMFDWCEKKAREEIEQYGTEWSGPYNRTEENGRKLAIVRACSECMGKPFIGEKTAEWAAELSLYLTRRLVYLARENISDNETHDKNNRVLRIIRSAGPAGIQRSALLRKCRFLKAKELHEIVFFLVQSNDVTEIDDQTSKKPRTIYRAR